MVFTLRKREFLLSEREIVFVVAIVVAIVVVIVVVDVVESIDNSLIVTRVRVGDGRLTSLYVWVWVLRCVYSY